MSNRTDWRIAPKRPVFATLPRSAGCGDWFEVYKVAADTFALCEPNHFEEVISFLLLGSARALLVDTGMGFAPIKPIVQQLTTLPVTVLNTHTHFDHTGGNYEFDGVLAFDTPLARARQTDGERAAWATQLAPEHIRGALPAAVDAATHATRPYHISAFVRDGEQLDLGGRAVEILHTPGHSADSLAILDRDRRLLLTADTFYEGPIYLTNQDSNAHDFARSARRLATLAPGIEWLLPSHNAPLASPDYLPALADAAERVVRDQLRGKQAFAGFEIWL